jgi:nucleotide-binding universal stress UspA family protein
MALLRHSLVPVASEQDATETAAALTPHLAQIGRITFLNVIESRPGAVNKAPTEKLRADAERFLASLSSEFGERVAVDTRIVVGPDVAQTILDTAADVDATAIVFRSRRRGRLVRLLSGQTASGLVTDPTVPVVSLAARSEYPEPVDDTGSVDQTAQSDRVEHTAGTDSPGEQGDDSSTRRADSRGRR